MSLDQFYRAAHPIRAQQQHTQVPDLLEVAAQVIRSKVNCSLHVWRMCLALFSGCVEDSVLPPAQRGRAKGLGGECVTR
jgi:hypothetical protein